MTRTALLFIATAFQYINVTRVCVTMSKYIIFTSHVMRAFYFRFGATLRIRDSLMSRSRLVVFAVREKDCTRRQRVALTNFENRSYKILCRTHNWQESAYLSDAMVILQLYTSAILIVYHVCRAMQAMNKT